MTGIRAKKKVAATTRIFRVVQALPYSGIGATTPNLLSYITPNSVAPPGVIRYFPIVHARKYGAKL